MELKAIIQRNEDIIRGYEDNHKPFLVVDNSDKEVFHLDKKKEGEETMKYKNNTIHKRSDGRFCIRYTENGVRKSIYGKSQNEVYQKAKIALQVVKAKKYEPIKLFDYIEHWLNTYKKNTQGKATFNKTKQIIEKYIKPKFKNKAMKDFNVSTINNIIAEYPNTRTKEEICNILNNVFKTAYEKDELIKNDISKNFIKYKHKRNKGYSLSQEERTKLIQSAKTIENGDIFIFYMFSGARENELLELRFENIQKDVINIQGTKTEGSNRYIPIFKPLKEILNNKHGEGKEKIFPISLKKLKQLKNEIEEKSQIQFKIKDLRTTFGTICAENGISESVIAKWMGHTTTKTTRKYYIKVLSDFEKNQKGKFDTNFDTNFDTTKKGNEKDDDKNE